MPSEYILERYATAGWRPPEQGSALQKALGTDAASDREAHIMSSAPEDCILAVRRSIHIRAAPERVWEEFSSFASMNAWWGHRIGEPRAGTHKGQWLDV